jgi:VWFA-related protein
MNRTPVSLLFSFVLLAPASFAQATPPQTAPAIQTSAQEVLLDVVVRDKKGKSLRDLEASNFRVTDNGEAVKITHFRLVDRTAEQAEAVKQAAAPPGSAPAKLDPLKQIRLVTLVFDHLGIDGRNLSRQAALELIKGEPEPNVYYSVFIIDQAVNALQPFTNNRDLLKKAITHATAGAFTEYASDSQHVHDELQRVIGQPAGIDGQGAVGQIANMTAGATVGPQGQGAAAAASAAAQQHMAELMLNMMQMDQSIVNDASRLSIFGLLGLVREQYRLPGRKTVMYFCDGLYVPPFLDEAFRSVISAANRANVSVYTLDARGLGAGAQNRAASDTLRDAADSSRRQAQSTGGDAVKVDQVKVFDNAETSMRLNAENSLSDLSDGTGGFLIANTNDLKKPLRQVDEDISLYYEISYTPPNMQYDGKFRKIAVKLDRSDVKIQSRLGYFALPPSAGPSVSPFELPLLTALQANPLPTAITFESAAMHFRAGKDSVRCAVLVQVPMKQLTTAPEQNGASIKAHLGMVALLRDTQDTVVKKFSQDLPLQVTNDKKAGLATGNFTFNRAFDLPPGRYTLETAVADYEGNKAGVQRVSFVVPPAEKGVTISDATLVRSFAKQATVDPLDPFTYQGGKITPSLDSHLRAEKGAVMSIYLVVYPDPSVAEKPTLTIQYLQAGKVLGGGDLDLPAADKDGRIPYVASSPIENFPAGDYAVQLIAKQGGTSKTDEIKFTITR